MIALHARGLCLRIAMTFMSGVRRVSSALAATQRAPDLARSVDDNQRCMTSLLRTPASRRSATSAGGSNQCCRYPEPLHMDCCVAACSMPITEQLGATCEVVSRGPSAAATGETAALDDKERRIWSAPRCPCRSDGWALSLHLGRSWGCRLPCGCVSRAGILLPRVGPRERQNRRSHPGFYGRWAGIGWMCGLRPATVTVRSYDARSSAASAGSLRTAIPAGSTA